MVLLIVAAFEIHEEAYGLLLFFHPFQCKLIECTNHTLPHLFSNAVAMSSSINHSSPPPPPPPPLEKLCMKPCTCNNNTVCDLYYTCRNINLFYPWFKGSWVIVSIINQIKYLPYIPRRSRQVAAFPFQGLG